MKFTLGWLKDYLETDADIGEIAERLTALGLEVEAVQNPATDFAPFTVGLVREARPHPDADRLQVCIVETGAGLVEVVCGAPNARTGLKGVFAPSGTLIPGSGTVLKKSKIRGVESSGMLLSERELGISNEHDSIIELPADARVGAAYADVVGLDDPAIEIAITPNRQDCLGVYGIARDLAAAGVGALRALEIPPVAGSFASPVGVELRFDAATSAACPYFVGRMVRGVRNGPSPEWMQRRLRAIGLRPISALVDITNYMSFAYARPLHVFDADAVAGGLHVRLSRPGETLVALDGNEYTLDGAVTVIADDDGVLAMGGVIGGAPSGCTGDTVNVFIESAVFDPVRTATTGRKYQIESDARYRFERGIDPEFTAPGCDEATRLVLELCGGEASEPVVAGAMPQWRRTFPFRASRVHRLGGIDLPESESHRILTGLGFTVAGDGEVAQVTPPPWRPDIDGEADLVEEIVRVHGFDKVPAVSLPRPGGIPDPILTPLQRHVRAARRTLAVRGLLEAVTWSFTSVRLAEVFGGGAPELRLVNPISSELDVMRPSVLPNLVAAVGRNLDRGATEIGLFEVGPTYASDQPEGQGRTAAAVRQGDACPRHWSAARRPIDALDAKADALAVLANCGIAPDSVTAAAGAPAWYHPGRSGTLFQNPRQPLAVFGELHPRALAALDVEGPVVACEVYLDAITGKKKKGTARPPLDVADLPTVERDFAFVVDATVAAGDVLRAASRADKLVQSVSLFDVFEGRGVPEGQRSLAIAVRLQPRDRTLTDQEIDAAAGRIVAAVAKATGGALRS